MINLEDFRVVDEFGVDISEVYYLIGSGAVPEYLYRYDSGQVLIGETLAEMLSSALEISLITGQGVFEVVCTMLIAERLRKLSEVAETEN